MIHLQIAIFGLLIPIPFLPIITWILNQIIFYIKSFNESYYLFIILFYHIIFFRFTLSFLVFITIWWTSLIHIILLFHNIFLDDPWIIISNVIFFDYHYSISYYLLPIYFILFTILHCNHDFFYVSYWIYIYYYYLFFTNSYSYFDIISLV